MRPTFSIRSALCIFVCYFATIAAATDLTEAEIAKLTPAQRKLLETTADREEKYNALVEEGKNKEAAVILDQILAAYEKVLGKEHPLTAQWVHEVGLMHQEFERFPQAKEYFERALAAQRKRLGAEHTETITSLHSLANMQFLTGDYAAARRGFDEVLRLRLKTVGEEDADTASVVNDLGLWADKTGDWALSKAYFERSLKIRRGLYEPDHQDVIDTLGNLALAEWTAGEYLQARDRQEEVLAIRRKKLGDDHIDTALSLSNLALVERDLGDLAGARKHFEDAVRIAKEQVGDKHSTYALFIANLSGVLADQNDLPAALPLAEQALAIQEEIYGREHDETILPLATLAHLKFLDKDFAAAAAYLTRAQAISDKALGEDSVVSLSLVAEQGRLRWFQGRASEAAPLLERAYQGAREKIGDDQFATAALRGHLAIARAGTGDFPAALADLDAARRVVRQVAVELLPGLPDRQLLNCLEVNDKEFQHNALSLGVLQKKDRAWREKSAAWLINGKAAAQEALAQQALLAREGRDPALAPIVNELLSLRRRLAALAAINPGRTDAANHRAEIEELEAQEQKLQKQIAAQQRSAAKLAPRDPAAAPPPSSWTELDDLRTKLPADGLFINFVRLKPINLKPTSYDDRSGAECYAAWLIPPAGAGDVQIVDLGLAADTDAAIKTLRDAITDSVAAGGVAQEGEVAAAEKTVKPLKNLAEKILHPLLPFVGAKTTTLILSPDSRLWLAPWQALPLTDGAFAIEKFRLRFLLSGRELTAAATPPAENSAIVFADPNYDLTPAAAEDSLKAIFQQKYQPPAGDGPKLRSLEAAQGNLQATRLPGTAAEARAIQPALEILTKSKALVYTDQFALEGVFKRMRPRRVIVLSTHGFFQEDQSVANAAPKWNNNAALAASGKPIENPLLRCGLLLAGCNRSRTDGGDDGVLTGLEILGADLRGTELVVLSACETGLGQVNDGDGVAGLRQAFQLAGAKSVVASLWQVPDRESAILMSDFFTELAAGKAKDDALCTAQLKRIASRRERFGAAHPFFWAAWTVTGE